MKKVNKMAFQVFEKFKFSQFSAKLQQKLNFLQSWKFFPLNEKTFFENLNHINFLAWVKFDFCYIFSP